MFGLVVEVAIEAGRTADAEKMLSEMVVPMVKATPGFVSGTWLQSDDGLSGTTVLIFDTEESARAAAATAPRPPEGSGVTATRFEAMRIAAQA
jgi:hypothetical protein